MIEQAGGAMPSEMLLYFASLPMLIRASSQRASATARGARRSRLLTARCESLSPGIHRFIAFIVGGLPAAKHDIMFDIDRIHM